MPSSEPTSEGQRLALLHRLCEVLGEEEAKTLMESLPPVHWHDLATKDDLKTIEDSQQRLRVEMHAEFANLRTEMSAEFKTLRAENSTEMSAEFKTLRAENSTEFKTLRAENSTEMSAEFKMLRAENKEHRGEVALQFAKQTRMMVFTMLGLTVPILGAILGIGLA